MEVADELIARNRRLLVEAEAARARARLAKLQAEQAVRTATGEVLAARQLLQWVAPLFNLRTTP